MMELYHRVAVAVLFISSINAKPVITGFVASIEVGAEIDWTCSLVGASPFEYFKDGQKIDSTGTKGEKFKKTAVSDDAGKYSCKATTSVTTESDFYTLTVTVPVDPTGSNGAARLSRTTMMEMAFAFMLSVHLKYC